MNKSWLSLGMVLVAGLAWGQSDVEESLGKTPGAQAILASAYWRVGAEKDALFDDGEFPSAIQILQWEVIWRPFDYQTVTDLGWMFGNIERFDLELATYVRYREAYPKVAEAFYPEAEFYFKKRIYKQVVTLLEPTLAFKEKPHPNSYRLLAHSYDRLGLHKESLAVWELYLKLNPNDAAAKVNRDKVKLKLDQGGTLK
jgi:tetratricopeptide (TPR) repeat protein